MLDYSQKYKEYLLNVKKVSSNTLEAYLRDVLQLNTYCTINGMSDIKEVDDTFFEKYLTYLDFLGKSDSTKSRITASLKCYFKFLNSCGYCSLNPMVNIKTHKVKRKLPDVLESAEIMQLLSQPDTSDYKGYRDKAMLELLYATGIKVSELIEIDINNINLQIGILNLYNTKHERVIPIYPAALKHLGEYISSVRPAIVQNSNEAHLFTNMNGQPMTRQGFWKIIKHYAEKAGIKKDITPHTLRHSFAAHLLENGAQLKDIKDMLGHSDISSTQVYAQFVKNKYIHSYAQFHPFAK